MGINVPGTKLNRFAECKMRIKLAQWMSAAELNVMMIKLVIQSTTIPGAVARYVDFPVRNNSLLLVTPVQNLGLNSMVEQVCQAEKTSSQADVKGQAGEMKLIKWIEKRQAELNTQAVKKAKK